MARRARRSAAPLGLCALAAVLSLRLVAAGAPLLDDDEAWFAASALMVRMPSCAKGMTFKEWRETGYPEFSTKREATLNGGAITC